MKHTGKWWVAFTYVLYVVMLCYCLFCQFCQFFFFVQFILPVPTGSSTKPLLIKAEPAKNAFGASVIIFRKRVKITAQHEDKQLCRH